MKMKDGNKGPEMKWKQMKEENIKKNLEQNWEQILQVKTSF